MEKIQPTYYANWHTSADYQFNPKRSDSNYKRSPGLQLLFPFELFLLNFAISIEQTKKPLTFIRGFVPRTGSPA